MWVLSVDAGSLLSVVKFDQKKAGAKALAEKHKATDPSVDYMLVRSRIKASLGYVCDVLDAISEHIPGYERPIVESMPSADYKYRTIISRDEWKRYLMFEVDGIDYDSHVKEETVRRQPEPKVKDLYQALSATWSAWAKLQDTPPYGGFKGGWTSKPDCKNCGHKEIKHSVKGDRCNEGWEWKGAKQVPTDKACPCDEYAPKPPPPAPVKSAKDSAAVFTDGAEVYPSSIYGSDWDDTEPEVGDLITEAWGVDEQGVAHLAWCSIWDGDSCICIEPPDDPDADADNWVRVGEQWVYQEPKVPNETKKQRRARNERNRRRRTKAQQKSPAAS